MFMGGQMGRRMGPDFSACPKDKKNLNASGAEVFVGLDIDGVVKINGTGFLPICRGKSVFFILDSPASILYFNLISIRFSILL
jgi:hypothetical protein